MGRKSLVANILCTTHNSQLGALDAIAVKVMDALRAVYDHSKRIEIEIDGRLLERWLLKCMINLGESNWHVETVSPPEVVVRHVFGLELLPPRAGMYAIFAPAQHGHLNFCRWDLLRNEEAREIVGLLMCLAGLNLLFSYAQWDIAPFIRKMGTHEDVDSSKATLVYRPVRLEIDGQGGGSKADIRLNWT